MTTALKGLNKRTTDTISGDTYLTPRWAVDYLLKHWTPMGGVICDPCACGFGGWTIGGHVVTTTARTEGDLILSDILPMSDLVRRANFRDIRLNTGLVTVVTNPPYNLLNNGEFMRWAWSQPAVVEVVVLTRFGYLCSGNGSRARWLERYIQPPKRLAFELLPEEGKRRLTHNASIVAQFQRGEITRRQMQAQCLDVHADASTLTGYRMSSTGVDHGWAVFRRGHVGPWRGIIEPIGEQMGLM